MRYKNTIFIFTISLFLLGISFGFSLNAQNYSNAQRLADAGIIVNNLASPEKYRLNQSITRGEMAKVMLELAGEGAGNSCEQKFGDITSTTPNDWVCYYVEKGLELGFLTKNKDFRPEDNISKSETLKMLLESVNLRPEYNEDNWQEKYLQMGINVGLVDNFNDFNTIATRDFVFDIGAKVLDYSQESKSPQIFSIDFGESMNKTSVEENLRIHPVLSYNSNWVDDQKLEIKIDNIINDHNKILINVSDKTLKLTGDELGKTLSYEFKIEKKPKVSFVSPKGLVSDRNQNITVRFSSPVVQLTNFDDMMDCPIEISPKLEGDCTWLTTSTFQFKPKSNLPMGAKFDIKIPKSFKNAFGYGVENDYKFNFTTPDFKLLSYPENLNLDESLSFVFNDELKIEDFVNNFSITGFDNNELYFSYLQRETRIEQEFEEVKNIIEISRINGDFGYSNEYDFSINSNLTSYNGNIGIKGDNSGTFKTNDFLLSSKPFILKDTEVKELYNSNNLVFSNDVGIITNNNPHILLEFYKEIDLDKDLFDTHNDFELSYLKEYDYKTQELKINKKKIVLKVLGSIQDELNLKINTSQISSSNDLEILFKTSNPNKIISFENIDYKTSCIEFSNKINTGKDNILNFEFDKYSNISYISEVNRYSRNNECTFEAGKNKYILYKQLNPNTKYNLVVNKNLININNYGLDKEYNYNFTTPVAQNEDKYVYINNYGNYNSYTIVPSIIDDLTISLETVNLSNVIVKVCKGEFDILSENYIKNTDCNEKEININNLGFKPNLSILSLKEIYGSKLDSGIIRVEVSKLDDDKTEYDFTNIYNNSLTYLISDIKASIKSGENNILWLYDFASGENKSNFIENIEVYEKNYDYNTREQKISFKKELDFEYIGNGLYEFEGFSGNSILLITLENSKQILLESYFQNNFNSNTKTYLYTDKPIYKPGEKVEIKGVSRIINPDEIRLNTGKQKISISNPRYTNLVNDEVTLSNNGSFEYSFNIPKDAILGNYNINVGNNSLTFSIEEYETPNFRVNQDSLKDYFLNTNKAIVDISSEFYSGIPLSFGEGRYSLSSTKYYFDGGKTTGYHFGEQRNFWLPIFEPDIDNSTKQTSEFILDNKGEYRASIDLDREIGDQIYTLSTTITDPNSKESISNNISFKGINSEKFLGIKFDNYFYTLGDRANIGMVAVDIEGNKLANRDFDFEINKINYKFDEKTRSIGEEKEKIVSRKLTTNNNGEITDSFEFENAGEYEFVLATLDGKYKTTKNIFVSGGGVLNPALQDNTIPIDSKKDKYELYEQAEIIINSPAKNIKGLLTIERLGKILDYKIIDINDYTHIENFEIKEEYMPNFEVGVMLVKDININEEKLLELKNLRKEMISLERELLDERENIITPYLIDDLVYNNFENNNDNEKLQELSILRKKELELLNDILPQKYTGNIELEVSYETQLLDVGVGLDKNSYRPGDKQIINLDIVDKSGNPISGEITISIIDEALLDLKKNQISIIEYFYANSFNNTMLISSMDNLIKRINFVDMGLLESQDDINKFGAIDGMGGGMESSDMAFDEAMETSSVLRSSNDTDGSLGDKKEVIIRSDFRDLAYYNGVVEVVDGKAQIEVDKLPDNISSWQIMGFVHTNDTKLGEFSKNFKTNLELSIIPQIPRFFVSNDTLKLGVQVLNNTDISREVDVSIESDGLDLLEKTKKVQVNSNSSNIIFFEAKVGETLENIKSFDISMKVRDKDYADQVKLTRYIKPSNTSEYIFTNGFTDNTSHKELLSLGDIVRENGYFEVGLGASVLTNLFSQIDRNLNYPNQNMYSRISFLENYKYIKNIFELTGKIDDFKNIKVAHFNGDSVGIEEVYKMIIDELPEFIENNFLRVQKECFSNDCKNINLTKRFLSLDIEFNNIDRNAIYTAYKNDLERKIKEYISVGFDYFIPSLVFGDFGFIDNNFKIGENPSTGELTKYLFYNLKYERDIKDLNTHIQNLKNNVLIETRGSFLSDRFNSLEATNYFIGVLTLIDNDEQLLLDNLMRYSLSNLGEQNTYRNNEFISLLKSLSIYIEKNLNMDTEFTGKMGLDGQKLLEQKFDRDNLFERYTNKFDFSQINIGGQNEFGFSKEGDGRLYYDFGVKYFINASDLQPRENGIVVSRNYYDFDEYNEAYTKECYNFFRWMGNYCVRVKTKNISPINNSNLGDKVVGEIQVILDRPRRDIVVNDFIPSGARLVNTSFDTTSSDERDVIGSNGRGFEFVENREDRIFLYSSYMSAGVYTYTYVFDSVNAGEFSLLPAVGEALETPEIWGRSSGGVFVIE